MTYTPIGFRNATSMTADLSKTGSVPPSVSGLVAWWDASDAASIVASSGSVSQWNDKSGHGYNLSQGTGASQPKTGTRTQNSKNVLDFDGGDVLANTSFVDVPSAWSFFVVALLDAASGQVIDIRRAADGNPLIDANVLNTTVGYHMRMRNDAAAIDNTPDQSISTGTPYIMCGTWDGSTMSGYLNGGTAATKAMSGAVTTDRCAVGGGAFGTPAGAWDGWVAEVIHYNAALSTTDRQTVRDYLKTKWAVY